MALTRGSQELFPTLESLRFLDRVFKDLRILVKLKRDLGLKSLKQKAWEAPTVDVGIPTSLSQISLLTCHRLRCWMMRLPDSFVFIAEPGHVDDAPPIPCVSVH
jgi:hypothetical protein